LKSEAMMASKGDVVRHVDGRKRLPFLLGIGEQNAKTLQQLTEELTRTFDSGTNSIEPFSQKTVRRYLQELLPDIVAKGEETRSRPYKYYLEQRWPLLTEDNLTEPMALALILLFERAGHMLPPEVLDEIGSLQVAAERRLQRGANDGYRDWRDKVRVVSRFPRDLKDGRKDLRKVIYDAVMREKCLTCNYKRSDGEEKQYTISPLGLVFQDGRCYVVCYSRDSNWEKPRSLPLYRFQSAELDESARFDSPLNFRLSEFAKDAGVNEIKSGSAPLDVELRIRTRTFLWLEERLIGDIKTTEPEGEEWRRIRVSVGNDEGFRRLLRQFGSDVEVLAPPALRKEFAELARTLGERYLGDAPA